MEFIPDALLKFKGVVIIYRVVNMISDNLLLHPQLAVLLMTISQSR
jgi:hypothetical protein